MTLLVTGGAGFIGSHFVREWLELSDEPVVTFDALTYAGRLDNLGPALGHPRHTFVHADLADAQVLAQVFAQHRPRAVVHLAAQTHVDRSIEGATPFVQANVVGSLNLLQASLAHWRGLDAAGQAAYRHLQVSTDEVYGELPPGAAPFEEDAPYRPRNPYAASKAAADHLAQAFFHTHGLPTLRSHSTDNYGPRHHPEKLIPLMVLRAAQSLPLPVYGSGLQRREWLHVSDHCAGLRAALASGQPGQAYNFGSGDERSNLDVVQAICRLVDEGRPQAPPSAALIRHVADRPGHDQRYAVSHAKARRELGWAPRVPFEQGLRDAVAWVLQNPQWAQAAQGADHRAWVARQYGGG